MDRNLIINSLLEKLRIILALSDYEFTANEDLTSLGLDSIKSVHLIVEIEEKFNIIFEDEELLFENFSALDKIVDRIQSKLVTLT